MNELYTVNILTKDGKYLKLENVTEISVNAGFVNETITGKFEFDKKNILELDIVSKNKINAKGVKNKNGKDN